MIHTRIYIYIGPRVSSPLKTTWNIALYTGNKAIMEFRVLPPNSGDLPCSMWNCHYRTRILITKRIEPDGAFAWFAAPKCLITR